LIDAIFASDEWSVVLRPRARTEKRPGWSAEALVLVLAFEA